MNGKKAKLIRKMCKDLGQWKKDREWVVAREVKKIAHNTNPDGTIEMKEVKRITIENKSRVEYRRAKKMYKNGEYTIG